jgi:class 3 adenylate cyclase
MGDADYRLSDAERDQVIEQLRHHCGEGRLTLDEFAERADVVYRARTQSDFADILADLPPRGAPVAVPIPTATPSVVIAPTRKRKLIVAIMSAAKRKGRWKVDEPILAVAFWGGVDLDLRGAQIDVPVVDITAWAVMGGVEIVVPEGIPVEMDGFMLMGGHENRVNEGDTVPGAPLVRIHAYGMWGGVTVRSKKPGEKRFGDEIAERVQQGLEEHVFGKLDRKFERAERHARMHDQSRQRRGGRYANPPGRGPVPPIPTTPQLPGQSLEGLIPNLNIPEPARAVLRHIGLIDSMAAESPTEVPPPDRGVPRGTITILFTDIACSTELAERLGDQRWLGVLQAHNALVREQVVQHGGTEVKVHGDGFMIVFPSARDALLCAISIQRSMATYRNGHPDTPVEVRIGLHTGEVVEEGGDYFGRNVILAARIAGHAEGGEILASGLVKELTDSSGDLGFDDGEDVELKGMSRSWRVHRVEWG